MLLYCEISCRKVWSEYERLFDSGMLERLVT